MTPLKSFMAGFRSTRISTVLTALILAGTLLAAAESSLRNFAFSRLPQKKFLIWTHDLWSFIPHRLGQLRQNPTAKDRIFLVGSSALYHSFYGVKGLEKTFHELGSTVQPEVVMLHTPTQSIGETLQIVDNLPVGTGTVVITTTPTRFRTGPTALAEGAIPSHLMLASPTLARFLSQHRAAGWRFRTVLPAFVNYLRLYLSMNRRAVHEGRLPEWNLFVQKESPQQLARLGEWKTEPPPARVPSYPLRSSALRHHLLERRGENQLQMELLALTIQTARAKGYQPVLLETPLNPNFQKAYPEKVAVLRAEIAAMAALQEIPYWDLAWTLGLEESDFMDTVHLKEGSPGRGRFHRALAVALAKATGEPTRSSERRHLP